MTGRNKAIELFQRGLTIQEVAERTGLSEFTLRKYRSEALRDIKSVNKQPMPSEFADRFSKEWTETVNEIRKYMRKDEKENGSAKKD